MGGQTCSICKTEARDAIDRALVAGESNRVIASQHGLSQAAVGRHRQSRWQATITRAAESRELAHGQGRLDQAKRLVDEALSSIKRSKGREVVNERDVLAGVREARHSLELTGRITGELRESRDAAPETALDAIIKLASTLSEAQLRGMAAREHFEGATIEAEGHVVR